MKLTLEDWDANIYPPALICLLSNKKQVVVFHIIQEWDNNSWAMKKIFTYLSKQLFSLCLSLTEKHEAFQHNGVVFFFF